MKKLFPSFYLVILLSILPGLLKAQNLSEGWAKTFTGSKQTNQVAQTAVDKYGNVYVLSNARGTVNAGGQITSDSSVHIELSSWSCNGSFRWMKTFGGAADLNTQMGMLGTQLKVDTMGGVYVLGYCHAAPAADSFYWSTDTTIQLAADVHVNFLVKYDTLGQFQWLRTPKIKGYFYNSSGYDWLSVSPSGQVFWFSMLDTGSYAGGNLTVSAPAYYAVSYNGAGNFQGATVMDMTAPSPSWFYQNVKWEFDQATDRFYGWLQLDTSYGPLAIGNTPINAPVGNSYKTVLAAFNKQGHKIWIRESDSFSVLKQIATNGDGNIYLTGDVLPGATFCGDTAKNALSQNITDYLMSLDSNGVLRWSKYAGSIGATHLFSSIAQSGNTIVVATEFAGTRQWGGYNQQSNSPYSKGYLLSVDASDGTIRQLVSFGGSQGTLTFDNAVDKNGNVYLIGAFYGNMTFANTTITSMASGSTPILLKYQNVSCNCNLLQPAFTANSLGSKTFQYSYTGNGSYSSISWNFGDGTPSVNAANPTHTFASYGVYTVCVTTTNACGSNTACKTLYVTPTGIEDINQGSAFVIYPNPASDKLTIEGNLRAAQLEIIDVAGRRLQQQRLNADQTTIDIGNWAPGMYYIRVIQKDGKISSHSFMKR